MEQQNNNLKNVYANSLSINSSLFEFSLKFIYDDVSDGKIISSTPIANINMSPQLAKAVVQLLNQNIINYEEQYGTINLSPFYEQK